MAEENNATVTRGGTADSISLKPVTLVDAHVHIYHCFDLAALLGAAHQNFANHLHRIEIRQGKDGFFTGILMLAETSGAHWYQQLAEYAREGKRIKDHDSLEWRFVLPPEDDCSLLAQSSRGESLVLVAGRQIATAEGLEVLALATTTMFSDGQSLKHTLRAVHQADAIAVIPWGAAKWLGERGAVLTQLLRRPPETPFFFGDNGGRPRFWRNPSHFKKAEAVGIRILPGTDPLPLQSEVSRVGSFGFIINKSVSMSQPTQDLKRFLTDANVFIRPYGQLQHPYHFLRNQIHLRLVQACAASQLLRL